MTYFRRDLFPSYLFSRRLFHTIVNFRLKSSSDLDSEFYKNCTKPQFYDNVHDNFIHICNSRVIWKYIPCYMYIHSHTIGLIGVTELGTVTFHFALKSASISLVDFSMDMVASQKSFFGQSLRWDYVFLCQGQYFLTFNKYYIIILVRITHGNRSLTS